MIYKGPSKDPQSANQFNVFYCAKSSSSSNVFSWIKLTFCLMGLLPVQWTD